MFVNMELYRVFYHICKTGSISKAAEQLFITQPAVSRAVKQLESRIGCPLFFRTSRGVKLTGEGEILFQYIEQAFNFITAGEKKINEVQDLLTGEIRIGVSDTLCKHYLLPYLEAFTRQYPGIRIKVTNPTTPEIINLLKGGRIDFGIINLPVEDEHLVVRKAIDLQDCFVAGEKYKHLAEAELSLADLKNYPVLLLERESNTRLFIDDFFRINNVSIVPEIELGNIDLLVQFARIGLGIACVIRNFVEGDLQKSQLYEIRLKESIPKRNAGVVSLKAVPLSSAARRFMSLLGFG